MLHTLAFILGRYNVNDLDRFFSLYTSRYGKLKGFAKSVRRPLSKLAPHLELGLLSQVTLARGRRGWQLIGAQNINSFTVLRADYHKLTIALQALKMVDLVTREESPDKNLFQLLITLFKALNQPETKNETELTLLGMMFQWQVLRALGVTPRLKHCLGCRRALGDQEVSWLTSERAGVFCDGCVTAEILAMRLTPANRQWLAWLLNNNFTAVRAVSLPSPQQHELAFLVQSFLQYQAESPVSRPMVAVVSA